MSDIEAVFYRVDMIDLTEDDVIHLAENDVIDLTEDDVIHLTEDETSDQEQRQELLVHNPVRCETTYMHSFDRDGTPRECKICYENFEGGQEIRIPSCMCYTHVKCFNFCFSDEDMKCCLCV
jgi:hypothetical protein